MRGVIVKSLLLLALATPTLATPTLAAPGTAPAERPVKQLLLRLKHIAESGRLAEPAYVASLLGMTFHTRVETSEPMTQRCAFGLVPRPTTTRYYTPHRSSALPPPRSARAASARTTGEARPAPMPIDLPSFAYFIAENHDCSGYLATRRSTDIGIVVDTITARDCVSKQDLDAWIGPTRSAGTSADGRSYDYVTDVLARAATSLSFAFDRACLRRALISRNDVDDARVQAAKHLQQTCMLPHQVRYCDTHPPFGYGAGSTMDEMDDMDSYAVKQCAPLDAYLAKVPRRPPPIIETPIVDTPIVETPIVDTGAPGQSTPCSYVRARLAAVHGNRAK